MPEDRPAISVVGQGVVAARPDRCSVTLGLQVTAETPGEALHRTSATADAVLTAVKAQGVQGEDVQTLQLSVQPHFDHRHQTQVGHDATYLLRMTLSELTKVGSLVEVASQAGGEALRVHDIRLFLSDREPFASEARRKAVDGARRKAAELAEAAGVQLGPIVAISEDSSTFPAPGYLPATRAVATAPAPPPPPVEAGTQQVSVLVVITFAIET